MQGEPLRVSYRQVLRSRRFLLLWLGQLVSGFGDWLALFALFSLVAFRFHGTPYQVAGIFLAFVVPWAFLGPLAGVFVDRWNLKRTMIASDLIRAVLAALLALTPGLPVTYLLIFVLSLMSCFFVPAQNAAIPLLVQKEELLVANALNAQAAQLNKILGPAAAGVLVAWAGEKVCFYLDSMTFLFSAGMLGLIALPGLRVSAAGGVQAICAQLAEGFRFLLRHRALLFVTLAIVAAMFAAGGIDALGAIYVRDILHSQPQVFGALVSLVGVGTILGALALGRFAQRQSKVYLVVVGILGLGVGVLAFASTSRAPVALAVGVWLGFAVSAVLIPAQTLVQQETPHTMLGRVSSTSSSLVTISQLASVAIAGKLADWIGIRNLFYVVGLALSLVSLLGYVYARVARVRESSPVGALT